MRGLFCLGFWFVLECVCVCSQFGNEAVNFSRKSLPYHYFVDFSVVIRNLRVVLRIYIIFPWFSCSDLSVILSLFRFTDHCGTLMEAKRNPSGSIPICPQNISREWILITLFGNLQWPYLTFYLCYFLVPPVLMQIRLEEAEKMLTSIGFLWFHTRGKR